MSGLRTGCCVWGWILLFGVLSLPGRVDGLTGSTEPEGGGPGMPRDGFLYITDPLADDIFRASDAVEIIGTIQGPDFQYYHAEWGYGQNPTEWLTTGITLTNGGTLPVANDTVGWWDTPSVAAPAMTTLRITVVFTSNDRVKLLHIQLDPSFKPGWPVKVYSNTTEDVGHFEPLVLDLNNDHNKEIVVYVAGNPPMLYVFDHTGVLLPNYPIDIEPNGGVDDIRVPFPVAGDMNNDGRDDIVIFRPKNGSGGCTNPPHVLIYDYDGQQLAQFPVAYPALPGFCRNFCSGRQMLGLADLDRNGTLEIIILGEGVITVLDNQGNTLSGWPKETPGWMGGSHEGSPSFANLDADDDWEIVVANDYADPYPPGPNTGKIYAWNLDGSDVPGWPIDTVGFSFASPSIGDLDNDGQEEIVVGFMYEPDNTAEYGICVYDKNGNVLPGWPRLQGREVWSNPVLADFNGDNELEIVVSSYASGSGNTTVFRHDGSIFPGWPQSMCWIDWYSPIVADITGDGAADVITNTNNGDGTCSIYAWDAQGRLIAGFPKFTGASTAAPTVVADLDDDGDLELIGSSNGRMAGSSWVKQGCIYVWELNTPLDPNSMHWPMYRRDIYHTGRYVRPPDCNENWTPDDEDIASGASQDCNGNGVPDECDIPPICYEGAPECSLDCNSNLVPDECEPEFTDIGLFVGQLLAESQDPVYGCMFDQNGDETLNGDDIQGFVNRLLPSP